MSFVSSFVEHQKEYVYDIEMKYRILFHDTYPGDCLLDNVVVRAGSMLLFSFGKWDLSTCIVYKKTNGEFPTMMTEVYRISSDFDLNRISGLQFKYRIKTDPAVVILDSSLKVTKMHQNCNQIYKIK